jgi:uncharacterized phage-associated protein
MTTTFFNTEKTIHLLAHIASSLGRVDFHRIFKILYFADEKHLALYGFPIVGDEYIAMKNGPVPSITYDMVKAAKNNNANHFDTNAFNDFLTITNPFFIEAKQAANTALFAETELECLNESIAQNGSKNFNTLTTESHDAAWEKADANNAIQIEEMARCGGANDAMLFLIKENFENEAFLKA